MDKPRINPTGVVLTNDWDSVTLWWNELSNDDDMGYSRITFYNIYMNNSGSGYPSTPTE